MKTTARLFLLLVLTPLFAYAHLKPLSDTQLSNVTGQAFVTVDRTYNPNANSNISYTRINLGMNVDIQTNVQKLDLGHYNRTSEVAGSSDVLVNNFSLGYIQNSNYYNNNPNAAQMLKPDGSSYQNGDIVPFKINNPFIEFAYNEQTNQVVGVRLGFGQAEGVLSGVIKYLTGNVNVNIYDTGQGLKNAQSQGSIFDQLVTLLTPVLAGGSPLQAPAELVHGAPNDPQLGQLDPIRAQYIGIPNGKSFELKGVNSLVAGLIGLLSPTLSSTIHVTNCNLFTCDVQAVAENCQVLGIQACFPLNQYNSFPIGQITKNGTKQYITGPATGMFMSFETQAVQWLKNVNKQNPTASDYVTASKGAFFNIPNGATQVNLNEALHGIQRYQTEYIDRGKGLF